MQQNCRFNGAHDRDRTGDLFLTKEVLYLLSYVSMKMIRFHCNSFDQFYKKYSSN